MDELDRQLAEIVRHWDEAPELQPKPLQRPHPPIIVGGTREAAHGPRPPSRTPTSTTPSWPTVEEARERKQALDDAARAAGREPLRFSMMTGCVVGRDRADLGERLAAFEALTGHDAPAISGTVDEVAESLREYEAVGVERAMLQHLVHEDVDDGRRAGRGRGPTRLGPCVSSSFVTPRLRPASRTRCGP